jgi:Lon-like protease
VAVRLPAVENVPGGRAWGSLSRRVRTLVVAGVLFVVLFVLALVLPVPYVILSPGPTYNTLATDTAGNQIITVDGTRTARTTGNLNLTTVEVTTTSVSAFQALSGWLKGDEETVPRSAVYPPGQSTAQTNAQNTAAFTDSQDSAITAAACELGYPKKFGVEGVIVPGPSSGHLQPADVIDTVDGTSVTTARQLVNRLGSIPAGTDVALDISRGGQAKTVHVTLGKPLGHRSGGSLGITAGQVCAAPYTVDLGLGNQIGGPSAGLMFALGIMDKVGPRNLTGGRFIAGTGTIDASGQVGPIGGIQLKMIAARAAGATVFLAPAGNCSDVVGATPAGLQVVKVTSLHGAVQDLLALQKGQQVPGC